MHQRPTNRPGKSALDYRIARHNGFLDAMLDRLSASDLPALQRLTTRDTSDVSIALLDAWATVADVLTFYQERIANEGFLATAKQRRSVLGLGRLVGYEPRPGVSASVYLSYIMELGSTAVIPRGTRAQSVPGPGELPQVFETSEPLDARAAWNALRPRLSKPQRITSSADALWFAGTLTRLAPGDILVIEELFVEGDDEALGRARTPVRVLTVEPDEPRKRTKVTVGTAVKLPGLRDDKTLALGGALDALAKAGATPPRSAQRLQRNRLVGLTSNAVGGTTLLGALRGVPTGSLTTALSGTQSLPPTQVRVYAMRVKAALFGHNAPPKVSTDLLPADGQINAQVGAAAAAAPVPVFKPQFDEWELAEGKPPESGHALFLDNGYEQILAGSFVVVRAATMADATFDVESAEVTSRSSYGMSGKTTRVDIDSKLTWFNDDDAKRLGFQLVRGTIVHAAPEELTLADETIDSDICPSEFGVDIELDALYDGLLPGRWVVIAGERSDLPGVLSSELAMLSGVSHAVGTYKDEDNTDQPLPGDTLHTSITLAGSGLGYCYRRANFVVRGNVVHATHGETRKQVLGSGDARIPLQHFDLKVSPLTYVSAPTASGVATTLEVRVNEVRWTPEPSLAALAPDEHAYFVRRSDAGVSTTWFGTGDRGARPPTGSENVRATYRTGIGRAGNVAANVITVLADRPLGVSAVGNEVAASGGADPETTASARRTIPLPLKALDRLVSLEDYADFARTFGGVGKADAVRLSDGRSQLVHVTVAGADDGPLADDGDVLTNLRLALHRLGDPLLPVVVQSRQLLALVINAKVRLDSDYAWEFVEPQLRATLLDTFTFEQRELAQDVTSSEVLAAMHRVRGVVAVDLDVLDWVPSDITPAELDQRSTAPAAAPGGVGPLPFMLNQRIPVRSAWVQAGVTDRRLRIHPGQLALLVPAVPDTLILESPWS